MPCAGILRICIYIICFLFSLPACAVFYAFSLRSQLGWDAFLPCRPPVPSLPNMPVPHTRTGPDRTALPVPAVHTHLFLYASALYPCCLTFLPLPLCLAQDPHPTCVLPPCTLTRQEDGLDAVLPAQPWTCHHPACVLPTMPPCSNPLPTCPCYHLWTVYLYMPVDLGYLPCVPPAPFPSFVPPALPHPALPPCHEHYRLLPSFVFTVVCLGHTCLGKRKMKRKEADLNLPVGSVPALCVPWTWMPGFPVPPDHHQPACACLASLLPTLPPPPCFVGTCLCILCRTSFSPTCLYQDFFSLLPALPHLYTLHGLPCPACYSQTGLLLPPVAPACLFCAPPAACSLPQDLPYTHEPCLPTFPLPTPPQPPLPGFF